MPKLISYVNFFFLKGAGARTSIGLLQRRQCIQIHQEADGPSLPAISRDHTDVRSTECTDPSTAPSGSRRLHETPVDREPRVHTKGLEHQTRPHSQCVSLMNRATANCKTIERTF